MKKILLGLLLVTGFAQAESAVNPTEDGPFEEGRIVTQRTSGYLDVVITDKKTGCQYVASSGSGQSTIALGCFPEYIDPKFKK